VPGTAQDNYALDRTFALIEGHPLGPWGTRQLALSAQHAAQLSEMRYRGGAASYLEVLTNETNYFNAQLGLAQAQLNELAGLVRIYRNLGGGWQ